VTSIHFRIVSNLELNLFFFPSLQAFISFPES
jgi:hypothetical protein